MAARIEPATAPFDAEVAEMLEKRMQGHPPLHLFTTLARDPRLFKRFFAGGLLDKGHLTLRQREVVIDRTTALCGSEYEWGVHVAFFGQAAGLDDAQLRSTAVGGAADACWGSNDKVLLRFCDELHRDCQISDGLWAELRTQFSEEAIIELLMLAGFYRTVSYLTNVIGIELEKGAPRFPQA